MPGIGLDDVEARLNLLFLAFQKLKEAVAAYKQQAGNARCRIVDARPGEDRLALLREPACARC